VHELYQRLFFRNLKLSQEKDTFELDANGNQLREFTRLGGKPPEPYSPFEGIAKCAATAVAKQPQAGYSYIVKASRVHSPAFELLKAH
jgi:hypothetical protein